MTLNESAMALADVLAANAGPWRCAVSAVGGARVIDCGGAVTGGFAVGVIENLAGTFIPYVGRELKLTIALILIVAVLMVRPSGLFGRRVVSRV